MNVKIRIEESEYIDKTSYDNDKIHKVSDISPVDLIALFNDSFEDDPQHYYYCDTDRDREYYANPFFFLHIY